MAANRRHRTAPLGRDGWITALCLRGKEARAVIQINLDAGIGVAPKETPSSKDQKDPFGSHSGELD